MVLLTNIVGSNQRSDLNLLFPVQITNCSRYLNLKHGLIMSDLIHHLTQLIRKLGKIAGSSL